VDTAAPAAVRLGCREQLDEVERLCVRGTGTDDQRRVEAESGSLRAVAEWLADETVRGL
jgi:gamma-glutamyl:cysteine ligase YbdK (ATP-grasp superfamily)